MLWLIWLAALLPSTIAATVNAAYPVPIDNNPGPAGKPEDLFTFSEGKKVACKGVGHAPQQVPQQIPPQPAPTKPAPVPVPQQIPPQPAPTKPAPVPVPVLKDPVAEVEQTHQATDWNTTEYTNNWYIDTCLKHHNYHRRVHDASDLQWDQGMAQVAQQIASSCIYAHNKEADPTAGQNIAAGLPPGNVSGVITELWYNGERPYFDGNYGIAQPSYQNFELWGHLTQLVWKDTSHFGCATQYCPQGLANTGGDVEPYFTVCNYKYPGNVEGLYANNVAAPKPAKTLHWYNN